MNQLSELDRKGYTIVRGFMDEDTCNWYVSEFQNQPGVDNRNYIARPVGEQGIEKFYPIFMDKGQQVLKDSIYDCDMLGWGDYFSIKDGVNSRWHLDHETFFFWQNHSHSYNFYIPIVKPDPAKSNLSVIPMDLLQQELPELARDVQGKGARMITEVDGQWVVYDEENCRVTTAIEPEVINRIMVTPELAKGDALIARGDIFHKTQDTSTRRISLSVRAISSRNKISRQTLVSGGASKLCYLIEGRGMYNLMLDLFDVFGVDEFEGKVLSGVLQSIQRGIKHMPTEEEFITRVLALRSPLDRKRLRLQARNILTYEKRKMFVDFASMIERLA